MFQFKKYTFVVNNSQNILNVQCLTVILCWLIPTSTHWKAHRHLSLTLHTQRLQGSREGWTETPSRITCPSKLQREQSLQQEPNGGFTPSWHVWGHRCTSTHAWFPPWSEKHNTCKQAWGHGIHRMCVSERDEAPDKNRSGSHRWYWKCRCMDDRPHYMLQRMQ